jgi:predicted DNA-binding transcriptional regulator AlpA
MSMAILDDYINREDLAKELGITPRTLDKYEERRVGPPKIKIGGRCYYKRSAVLAWIEGGAAQGAELRGTSS